MIYELIRLCGQNTIKASAKETIMLDSSDNLLEILSFNLDFVNKDTKISYNKVLAKADVDFRIMFLTDDGRIKFVTEQVPVMGFIDLVGVSDSDLCDVKYKLKNVVIKPSAPEEHSISVEAEVEMFCRVFGNKDVSTISDMYSPSVNLEFSQNSISTMVGMKISSDSVNIRERVKLDDVGEFDRICDVKVDAVISEKNVQKDGVSCSR